MHRSCCQYQNEEPERKALRGVFPVIVTLAGLCALISYIAFRFLSYKAYQERWKDYSDCGLG